MSSASFGKHPNQLLSSLPSLPRIMVVEFGPWGLQHARPALPLSYTPTALLLFCSQKVVQSDFELSLSPDRP